MEIITQEFDKTIHYRKQMIHICNHRYVYKTQKYENGKLLDENQYISGNFRAYKYGLIYELQNNPESDEYMYIINKPFDYALTYGIKNMQFLKFTNDSIILDIFGNKYTQIQYDGYYSEDKVDIYRMYDIIKDIATFTDNKPFFEQDGKRWINAFWYLPTVEQLEIEYYKNRFLEECLK